MSVYDRMLLQKLQPQPSDNNVKELTHSAAPMWTRFQMPLLSEHSLHTQTPPMLTSTMVRWMEMVKMACEREERSLSLVDEVERFSMQSVKKLYSSSAVVTLTSRTPTTW